MSRDEILVDEFASTEWSPEVQAHLDALVRAGRSCTLRLQTQGIEDLPEEVRGMVFGAGVSSVDQGPGAVWSELISRIDDAIADEEPGQQARTTDVSSNGSRIQRGVES